MMNNFLTIKNFGPIKEATIELKPMLILIGGQGTGKSTLAKVLTICRDCLWYVSLLEKSEEYIYRPFRQYGIEEYFHEDSYIEYFENSIHIIYSDKKFNITCNGSSDEEELSKIFKLIASRENFKIMQRLGLSQAESVDDFFNKNKELIVSNYSTSLYIPAERNFAGVFSQSLANMMFANVPLPFTFISYIKYFEQAKKKYPVYEVPFLNITYKNNQDKEGILVSQGGENRLLSLGKCSSGIQSALPMLMVLEYCIEQNMYNSYVIEEPEQNLFPNNQLSILRFMIKKIHGGDKQPMHTITTHSPYILTAVNVSLLAGIIGEKEDLSEEVSEIISTEYQLKPGNVAAYALGDDEEYCRNIINEETGTIDQNYLDSTSVLMGQEYNKLYKLYLNH